MRIVITTYPSTDSLSLVLGIETTANVCSAAIGQESKIIATISETIPYNQANHLMGFIEKALRDAGVDYKDLTAIAVNRGPGSFTGIRVGMAAAQALAFAGNLPLLGLTSFDILCYQYSRKKADFPLLIALDTRRHDYYTAYYENRGEDLSPVLEILPAEAIRQKIDMHKCVVIGDQMEGIDGSLSNLLQAEDLLHAVSFYGHHDPKRFDPTPFYMRPPSVSPSHK